MENASKALIIVSSILIGMVIISLAAYLFTTFGQIAAQNYKQMDEDKTTQFNSQFTSYEGKEDITIYDVISVANLATNNNKYYELDRKTRIINNDETNDNYVFVIIKQGSKTENIEFGINDSISTINKKYTGYISDAVQNIGQNNTNELSKYTCKAFISKTTRRVYKVLFTEE